MKEQATHFKRFSRKPYGVFNSLKKVVNTGIVAVSVLTFANTTNSYAQNTTQVQESGKNNSGLELEEVLVTASRITLPTNLASRLVTVISNQEIQNAPVQNLQDLLNYVAGVDITQRGPHGVQADISIRGGSFDQVAILLNGVNISNPQTGHLSLNLPINLSDIERIEIIHGASTITYGASAFSGGINIITKKNPDHKATATLQGGMYGLFNGEANGVLHAHSNGTHQLSAGYKRADGDRQNSDYRIGNLFWQSCWQIDQSLIDLQAGYLDKAFGANTFYSALYPNQYEKTRNYYASLKAQTGGDRLKFTPLIYWNRTNDEFQLIKGNSTTVPYNYHQSDVYGGNLNIDYTSQYGITSFGAELRNEAVISSVLGNTMPEPKGKYTRSVSRTNVSYALEHNFIMPKWTISAGVLANYNTSMNGKYKFFPALNIAYRPHSNWHFFTSWNESTRMPSFTELFYRTRTHQSGNNLRPEYMKSAELGTKYINSFLKGHLIGYINIGKNLLDWTKTAPSDAVWVSTNHGKVKTYGFDFGLQFNLAEISPIIAEGTTLRLDYTKQYQKDSDRQLISAYAFNYLRDKFVAKLTLPITDKINTSWSWRIQKRNGVYTYYPTPSSSGILEEYPSFSTLDVQISYKPTGTLKLFANINNLYDTYYYDLGNVPQPGIWAMGGLTYTFR